MCVCVASAAHDKDAPHCGHCPASRSRHHRTMDCAETSSHIEPGCHAALQSKQTLSPQSGQTQRLHGPNRLRPCHGARRRPRAAARGGDACEPLCQPQILGHLWRHDGYRRACRTAGEANRREVRRRAARRSAGCRSRRSPGVRTSVRGSRSAFSAATIASYRSSCDSGSTLATSCSRP